MRRFLYKKSYNILFLHLFSLIFFLSFQCLASEQEVVQPPQRVVSLKPNITSILMDLGVGPRVWGVTTFCTKPHSQAAIVADYTSIDIEAVVRLRPDVVFVSPENTQEKQVEKLKELGVRVVLLRFRTLKELRESILEMGRVLHRQDQAAGWVKKIDEDLAIVKNIVTSRYASKNRIALVVQRKPLMVATEQTFLGDLFRSAGFANVFARDKIGYPLFDDETLIRTRPDLIIALVHEKDSTPFAGQKPLEWPIADFLPHAGCVEALKKQLE